MILQIFFKMDQLEFPPHDILEFIQGKLGKILIFQIFHAQIKLS